MIGLMVLGVLVFWLVMAIAAGVFAYRRTGRRWVFLFVALLVAALPFWDVIPGVLLFHKTVRDLGGFRVFHKVTADGFLDQSCRIDCARRWQTLLRTKYRYIEVAIRANSGYPDPLQLDAGYHVFRLELRDAAGCEAYRVSDDVRAGIQRDLEGKEYCVVATRHERPVSRYRYEVSNGLQRLPGTSAALPILGLWQRVVDMQTNEVLGQSYQVRFISWIGRHSLGVPQWKFEEEGKRRFLMPSDVIEVSTNQ
jgi:hypothetical protein